ncbi:MAG: serine protease [Solirubrobacteraceae bacterium]|nr:serine protease [Solirubrobacteraceae bacterium]
MVLRLAACPSPGCRPRRGSTTPTMAPPSPDDPTVPRPLLAALAGVVLCLLLPAPTLAASFRPNVVVVGYARASAPATARAAAIRTPAGPVTPTRTVRLAPGVDVRSAAARLRRRPGVAWAVPDYVAHVAQAPVGPPVPASLAPLIPNDPGRTGVAGGWQQLQWNFAGPFGVNAPQAWANLTAVGRPGGAGVTVAVLDTGVAYANHGRFRRSPDFTPHQFVRGYDFVDDTPHPDDHNGHGTHIAGTIAEKTGNGIGLTGLAYGARIMPVRVLDSHGDGDASTIAAGVIYAVRHHADVINMSFEFSSDVTAAAIPELTDAIAYAHNRGVIVIGAAGNEGAPEIAYPARARYVLAVGATTEHGCLSDFSNDGRQLGMVAPGGGADASTLPADANCHPQDPAGANIYQETFLGSSTRVFGFPPGYEGTSMATPHVSAAAALVIASGVLGPKPSPEAVIARLKATARPLGAPGDGSRYGAGLLDAAAATAPGGPGAVVPAPAVSGPAPVG